MEVSFAIMNLKLYMKSLTSEYALQQPRAHGTAILLRDNAILGLTVFKTTEETKCDLEVAVAWEGEGGVSVYNSIKKVNRFSKLNNLRKLEVTL